MPVTAAEPESRTECTTVRGDELLARVRALVHQGNVRRIVVITEDRRSILEFPLPAGATGAGATPALVAIGAIAALAETYTLLIEAAPSGARAGNDAGVTLPPGPRYSALKRTPAR